jgi:endonuclease YncB( thermonuclease family)
MIAEYIPFMMIPRLHVAALAFSVVWMAGLSAAGADTSRDRYFIGGPVAAELVSVVDGDTLMVNARPWPQQTVAVLVRIRGIDTPELRAKCPAQRTMAIAAKRLLTIAMQKGNGHLMLSAISGDKYFGRVVADVTLPDQRDAASMLLASGLARPYDGGRKSGTGVCR